MYLRPIDDADDSDFQPAGFPPFGLRHCVQDAFNASVLRGRRCGTVMIGEEPCSEEFKRQFDWPDAVIPFPSNSPDIGPYSCRYQRRPHSAFTRFAVSAAPIRYGGANKLAAGECFGARNPRQNARQRTEKRPLTSKFGTA